MARLATGRVKLVVSQRIYRRLLKRKVGTSRINRKTQGVDCRLCDLRHAIAFKTTAKVSETTSE